MSSQSLTSPSWIMSTRTRISQSKRYRRMRTRIGEAEVLCPALGVPGSRVQLIASRLCRQTLPKEDRRLTQTTLLISRIRATCRPPRASTFTSEYNAQAFQWRRTASSKGGLTVRTPRPKMLSILRSQGSNSLLSWLWLMADQISLRD